MYSLCNKLKIQLEDKENKSTDEFASEKKPPACFNTRLPTLFFISFPTESALGTR